MSRKLGTSDLHFGHAKILNFTKRHDWMMFDGFGLDLDSYLRLKNGEQTEEGVAIINKLHDYWLIERLNKQICSSDIIYHTGDFSFYKTVDELRRVIDKLDGTWHFTLGNHDNESKLREACKGTRHKVLGYYHEIKVNQKKVCLFHFPIAEWNSIHRGSWHLHGHLHGTVGHGDYVLQPMDRRMDIGIDAHPEYKLFNLDELIV